MVFSNSGFTTTWNSFSRTRTTFNWLSDTEKRSWLAEHGREGLHGETSQQITSLNNIAWPWLCSKWDMGCMAAIWLHGKKETFSSHLMTWQPLSRTTTTSRRAATRRPSTRARSRKWSSSRTTPSPSRSSRNWWSPSWWKRNSLSLACFELDNLKNKFEFEQKNSLHKISKKVLNRNVI